jgi:leucine dehydrogenase
MLFATEHQAICYCRDEKEDLKAIIAIHSLKMGPALGGTRVFPYATTEEALADVQALSRAMTYKAAAADLPFGGGKAVVMADPTAPGKKNKLRAFCKFINLFHGNFQTGEDLGTNVEDMEDMRKLSPYVHHGSRDLPDSLQTSALTATGVLHGIEASLQHVFGNAELRGRHVTVQGTGKVGYRLVRLLREKGCKVTLADTNRELASQIAKELVCENVNPEKIMNVEADVFSPCAAGQILNPQSVEGLRVPIVAGSANNQLSDDSLADVLQKRGILYAPDYVINAGGLISAVLEMGIEDQTAMLARIERIGPHLLEIFSAAKRENTSPLHIINQQVARKLAS